MGIEHMKYIKLWVFLGVLTFTVSCGQQKRYIQYKVKSGETMSTIAEKLNMKTKDLLRLNPDFTETPKPNSFIVVPESKYDAFKNTQIKNGVAIEEIDTTSETNLLSEKERMLAELKEKFDVYEVKKGDTFYSLEKRFKVTRGELLLLNPELKEGLKEGTILKIKEIEIITEENNGIFYEDYIKSYQAIKLSLLLPFRGDLYDVDTLAPKDIFLTNAGLVNIATDFYLGAELAVDSLRNQGLSIDFNVFDTGARRSNKIASIIAQQNLNSNDLIIGPLYSEEAQLLASNVNVPVVFPVYSSNQSEFNNSNIIKSSPDKDIFKDELLRYINEHFDEGNLIIVGDDTAASLQVINGIKYSLNTAVLQANTNVLTPRNGFIEKSRFLQILKPNTKNWVIIATNNEVIVADVINSLISLPEETTTKVFTYDRGKIYDKIDNRKLAKIGFTYVSEEFVDETSLASKVFNKQYLAKNNALPSFYATKGFDITYDMLIRLASGKNLQQTFNEGPSIRVDAKFDFKNRGVIENEGLFIVQMNPDLSLTKLK